jgi:hypothetical protein
MGTMMLELGGDLQTIIDNAIACGYRLFDGAALYGNEKLLGDAYEKNGIDAGSFLSAASSRTAGTATTTQLLNVESPQRSPRRLPGHVSDPLSLSGARSLHAGLEGAGNAV